MTPIIPLFLLLRCSTEAASVSGDLLIYSNPHRLRVHLWKNNSLRSGTGSVPNFLCGSAIFHASICPHCWNLDLPLPVCAIVVRHSKAVMCYRWEESIVACHNCSYVDFQQVIRASCNIESAGRNHRTISQVAQRPSNAGHPQSSKHDARENMNTNMRVHNREVQSRQPAEQQDPPSSSSLDSRIDWARRCRPKRSHQDSPSAPGRHTRTDPTGSHIHQGLSRDFSQKHRRTEETGELTAGMNKLPPSPSWEDEQIILPLVQEQLWNEELIERQEQRLAEIWAPYERERQALAASHIPEMEEMWTPDLEEGENLEREMPLEKKISARSVHDGGVRMRSIMNEDDTWPHGHSAEEEEIWTRENGGMLTSPRLKKILRIQTLQASWEEGRLESSDENVRAGDSPVILKREERDEVTPSFSEGDTSADYPP